MTSSSRNKPSKFLGTRARELAHDAERGQNLCKLSKQRGSISQVARELGVSSSQLSKWCTAAKVYGDNSFPGRGVERLNDGQREIKELKKALKDKELYVGKSNEAWAEPNLFELCHTRRF